MVRLPDLEKQRAALELNQKVATELNTRAVAEQNKLGEKMVCWALPVYYESGNTDYVKFVHVDCATKDLPEEWVKLLINETIKQQKCMQCGYALDHSNKEDSSVSPEGSRKGK